MIYPIQNEKKKDTPLEKAPLAGPVPKGAAYLTDIGCQDSRASILPTQSIQVDRCEENFLCQYMRPRIDGIFEEKKTHSNNFWACLNPPSCTATRDVLRFHQQRQ